MLGTLQENSTCGGGAETTQVPSLRVLEARGQDQAGWFPPGPVSLARTATFLRCAHGAFPPPCTFMASLPPVQLSSYEDTSPLDWGLS